MNKFSKRSNDMIVTQMRNRDASNPILTSGERNALAALRSHDGDTEHKSVKPESLESGRTGNETHFEARSQSHETSKGQELRRLTLEKMQAHELEKVVTRN